MAFFTEPEKAALEFPWKSKKLQKVTAILSSKNNLEAGHSYQNVMVLTKTNRPTENVRDPEINHVAMTI